MSLLHVLKLYFLHNVLGIKEVAEGNLEKSWISSSSTVIRQGDRRCGNNIILVF